MNELARVILLHLLLCLQMDSGKPNSGLVQLDNCQIGVGRETQSFPFLVKRRGSFQMRIRQSFGVHACPNPSFFHSLFKDVSSRWCNVDDLTIPQRKHISVYISRSRYIFRLMLFSFLYLHDRRKNRAFPLFKRISSSFITTSDGDKAVLS